MISRVQSFVLQGINACPCEIEVDLHAPGMNRTSIVGLPDTAVRESIERVRTAIVNSGFRYPKGRVTINLAPANIPKEGPVYDLAIAVALLHAHGTIEPAARGVPCVADHVIAGELALDGRVRPVRGVISLALLGRQQRAGGIIVPHANAGEAAAVHGVDVRSATSLDEVVGYFNGRGRLRSEGVIDVETMIARRSPAVDFAEVRGQEAAKRALTIAAAGAHNVLMLGPPGTGKSLIAKALSGILPPLSRDEALEVTRIYSSLGAIPPGSPLVLQRPVRAPHHTATVAAIIGGGSGQPRPGDVSLAHRGVLFLDEMPEFARSVLETLRQPLEDGVVTIARSRGSVRFPARFMLVGALNPSGDGGAARGGAGRRDADRYLARLSRPLVDRIDLHVEVAAVPFRDLTSRRQGTDTATMRQRVLAARQRQTQRQGAATNAELSGKQLDEHAPLDPAARSLVGQALTELGLSARAYDKIRRVARTIADVDAELAIQAHHVAEAVQYRLLDRERV